MPPTATKSAYMRVWQNKTQEKLAQLEGKNMREVRLQADKLV